MTLRTADFHYDLPPELIAQTPLPQRDASRLLVLHRRTGQIEHRHFHELGQFLNRGDILVANNSRVIPARLFGHRLDAKGAPGARVELLLLAEVEPDQWRALAGGRRLSEGVRIQLLDHDEQPSGAEATISAVLDGPQRLVRFNRPAADILDELGHVPLPPYIRQTIDDPERYQTVYGQPAGSAAAPTAGLHFTGDLLLGLRDQGVLFETGTLHVGLDTFQPVKTELIADHIIHRERISLTADAARRVNEAKLAGGRLVAVGTTAMRLLETASLRSAGLTGTLRDISRRDAAGETTNFCPWKPVAAVDEATDLYIYPGYLFRAVDALITNFHLPGSTLLMLVAAFAGQEQMRAAYDAAIAARYRFYSFGDAMLIL